jgi:RNA polymerase sigma-70 factor (ECF subfamily)
MGLFPRRLSGGVQTEDPDSRPAEAARAAFDLEDVARRHGASILRRSRAILRDPAEAEDAAQEVFVLLLRKGSAYRGDAALTSFLYRVTTNVCLNRLRARRRRHAREQGEEVRTWMDQVPQDADARARAMERAEELLETMSDLEQQVFVLRALDGLSLEEIATVTGRSRKTVAKRLSRIQPLIDDALREERNQ